MKFAKSRCFAQHTTNPHSPQKNGMAERAVQTAKSLVDLDEPEIGLLNYHASPHSAIAVSPAVALMGRQLATRLPVVREQLSPGQHRDWTSETRAKTMCKRCYDRRHGVRKLSPLQNGELVLLKLDGEKQWSTPSNVFRSDPQNRSYVVKTGAGICYRRNRKHLQGVPNVLPPVSINEPDDTDIQAEDPGKVVQPDDPGDAVELPVDVPAGLNKSAWPSSPSAVQSVGRAVRRPSSPSAEQSVGRAVRRPSSPSAGTI